MSKPVKRFSVGDSVVGKGDPFDEQIEGEAARNAKHREMVQKVTEVRNGGDQWIKTDVHDEWINSDWFDKKPESQQEMFDRYAQEHIAHRNAQVEKMAQQIDGWYHGVYYSKGSDGFRPRESIHDRDPLHYPD